MRFLILALVGAAFCFVAHGGPEEYDDHSPHSEEYNGQDSNDRAVQGTNLYQTYNEPYLPKPGYNGKDSDGKGYDYSDKKSYGKSDYSDDKGYGYGKGDYSDKKSYGKSDYSDGKEGYGKDIYGNADNGKGTYNNEGYGKGTYNNEGYGKGTYKNGGYGKGTYNNGGYGKGTYNNGGYGKGTYNNEGYGKGTYNNEGYGKGTYSAESYGQVYNSPRQSSYGSGYNSNGYGKGHSATSYGSSDKLGYYDYYDDISDNYEDDLEDDLDDSDFYGDGDYSYDLYNYDDVKEEVVDDYGNSHVVKHYLENPNTGFRKVLYQATSN